MILNPGLSKSPQLLLATAWLVGAKKVADRHSSPSNSAKQGQHETSNPPLMWSPRYCMAQHAHVVSSLLCGLKTSYWKNMCHSKSAEPAERWIAWDTVSVLSDWPPFNHATSCWVGAWLYANEAE